MRVLLLADSSHTVGTGHVMRSLVLSERLARRGVDSLVAGTGASLVGLSSASLAVCARKDLIFPFSARERFKVIESYQPDLVILDGYHYPVELFRHLDRQKTRYGIIDDYGITRATAPQFVLNQNPSANTAQYEGRFADSVFFLGLNYCLLRPEIRFIKNDSERSESGYVFVAMGGSDPQQVSLPVATAVSKAGQNVKVAVGPMVRSRKLLSKELQKLPRVSEVSEDEYESALSGASLAILSAGSSIWEATYLGIDTLALIVAENQRESSSVAQETLRGVTTLVVSEKGTLPSGFASILQDVLMKTPASSGSEFLPRRIGKQSSRIGSRVEAFVDFLLEQSGTPGAANLN